MYPLEKDEVFEALCNASMRSCPAAYISNELMPGEGQIEQTPSIDGKITFVSTSMLQGLAWLKAVAKTKNAKDIQFIVIDFSTQVNHAWLMLQSDARQSTDMASFMDTVQKNLQAYSELSDIDSASTKQVDALIRQLRALFIDRASFEFYKDIIQRMILLPLDWEFPQTFAYVNQYVVPQSKVVVYASNIIEYHCREKCDDSIAKQLLANIQLINPTLTIHTRTSMREFIQLGHPGLVPHCAIFVKKNPNIDAQLAELDTPAFVSIYGAMQPTNPQMQERIAIMSQLSLMLTGMPLRSPPSTPQPTTNSIKPTTSATTHPVIASSSKGSEQKATSTPSATNAPNPTNDQGKRPQGFCGLKKGFLNNGF